MEFSKNFKHSKKFEGREIIFLRKLEDDVSKF